MFYPEYFLIFPYNHIYREHPHLMVVAAVWIQFIYHDVAHTPQMAGHLGQRLKCCNVEFEDFHPECYPIKISQNDPFYKKFGLQCQEYARSGTASRVGCTLGPREQINQVTSFIGEFPFFLRKKLRFSPTGFYQVLLKNYL